MTDDETRADVLRRAITATAGSNANSLGELFTDELEAWSPGLQVSSRAQLAEVLRERDATFGGLDVRIGALDVVGDRGYAEWVVAATHMATLTVDDVVIEAHGAQVTVRGLTVAEFSGNRIDRLRQYWDEGALLACLGLVEAD